MKLLTIIKNGKYSLGVQTEKGIIDISAALTIKAGLNVPDEIMDVIERGPSAISALESYLTQLDLTNENYILDENEIQWGPCVTKPEKIICVGLNYRRHADETNAAYPEVPILFNKFHNSLSSHKCDLVIPKATAKLDYEVELGIVIGKTAKHVSKEQALEYVFGYFTANDLSARDLQFRTNQWLLGKSCDGFCPIGPYLVTKDEVGNPQNLQLRTIVNGEERQNSNTADMIFSCAEIISYISEHMTLVPGDIILTGTPEGVVLGYPEDEQVYIKPGDIVTAGIEKLGELTNRFVKEV